MNGFPLKDFALALTLVELENDDAGNPGNRETGETEQADEEEFKSNKHVSILNGAYPKHREWISAGRKAKNAH